MKMNKQDYLDYLTTFRNPLDKSFRWEVNTLFNKKLIDEATKTELLQVSKKAMSELQNCIRNEVPLDTSRVGNFYIRQAERLYNRHLERYARDRNYFKHEKNGTTRPARK